MDKQYRSILKYIYKHPYIAFSSLKSHFSSVHNLEGIVCDLEQDNYISFRVAISESEDKGYETYDLEDSSHLLSLPVGNEYIELHVGQSRRWRITTIIAVIAAVGGYREEVVLLIQALSTLLQ